jgi:hypothetical protein
LEGVLTTPVVVGNGPLIEKDSGFHVVVDVGGQDELALTKTCDALAGRVEMSSTYQEAADAALALSYVTDPIAVAFMRRVLIARPIVGQIITKGLEKIANVPAVQVLAEAPTFDPANTDLYRASLRRVRNQTNDPQIRQLVDRLLSGR